ncbi:MAG TPA: hypothetical protein VNQ73_13885, partial [Ilumatobacter sp.]|nr:hypothetical protein [Ilumatobacter sp.]
MTIVADTCAPVDPPSVTLGVDTHADTHVGAVIDPLAQAVRYPAGVSGCVVDGAVVGGSGGFERVGGARGHGVIVCGCRWPA